MLRGPKRMEKLIHPRGVQQMMEPTQPPAFDSRPPAPPSKTKRRRLVFAGLVAAIGLVLLVKHVTDAPPRGIIWLSQAEWAKAQSYGPLEKLWFHFLRIIGPLQARILPAPRIITMQCK